MAATDKTTTIIFKGDDQISPAINAATKSVAGLSQSFTGVDQASSKTSQQIKAELTKAISEANNQLAALSRQKISPSVELKQGQVLQQLADLKSKLAEIDKVVIKPQVDTESLVKSQLQVQALGQLVGKLNELKGAALDAFGEFRKAQRNAASEAKDIVGLSSAVKTLGSELKNQVSATELLDNATKVAQKGYRETADNINVLKATQKLSIATNTDFNVALEATTDILKAYNLPSTEAANVTALLDTTATKAGTSVGELAPQIGKLAATSSSAGISINDMLGFIGNAGAKSVDAKTAVGALNKVINDLSTGDLVKKGQELGVSFDAAAIKTGGLNEFLNQLKTNGLTSADSLQKLGFNGKELSAIQASLATGINTVAGSQDNLNKKLNVKYDPALAANNQLKDSLVDLGAAVAPIANQIVLATRSMVAAFTQLPAPVQQTLGVFIGVVGLATSASLAFGAISSSIGIASASLGGIKAALLSLNTASAATTALTAAESAAFGGLGVASEGAAVGVGGLSASFNALALSAAAVALPIAAIGSAIGLMLLVKNTQDLKNFNDELDQTSQASVAAGNDASRTADKLKSLANQRNKSGGIVSDEQVKKEQDYLKLADQELETQKRLLVQTEAFSPASDAQKAAKESEIAGFKISIKQIEDQKVALTELIAKGSQRTTANLSVARSEAVIEIAAKKRIEAEKRGEENQAKNRTRSFEAGAKAEGNNFEKESRDSKLAFERSLNVEKKIFDAQQKADRISFERGINAENKQFSRDQKIEQKTFDANQKVSDIAYEKQKQADTRAFDKAQELAKEAFDKKQRDDSLKFDLAQGKEKTAADDKFAQKRLDIDRKLQLDAAKSPQDKAKLEVDFKAADEKAAKEKEAFAQLKIQEEAFAEKQKVDKLAFDEKQTAAKKAEDDKEKVAKQAFEDAQKVKDEQREVEKQLKKEVFEEQLNVKKEAFELALNVKKEAYDLVQTNAKQVLDEQQAAKKVVFEDAEKVKKEVFEVEQNTKKAAFEDGERVKKQDFEDSLKALERAFKADERAKDVATAQQIAAIKANSGAASRVENLASSALGLAKPLATGGRFNKGEQLLVGEKGRELVTFGSEGYVSSAANSKQILDSNNSNSAPNSVSTAKLEQLMSQVVGKLERQNISVTTSENPSDVIVKMQQQQAKREATNAGI